MTPKKICAFLFPHIHSRDTTEADDAYEYMTARLFTSPPWTAFQCTLQDFLLSLHLMFANLAKLRDRDIARRCGVQKGTLDSAAWQSQVQQDGTGQDRTGRPRQGKATGGKGKDKDKEKERDSTQELAGYGQAILPWSYADWYTRATSVALLPFLSFILRHPTTALRREWQGPGSVLR